MTEVTDQEPSHNWICTLGTPLHLPKPRDFETPASSVNAYWLITAQNMHLVVSSDISIWVTWAPRARWMYGSNTPQRWGGKCKILVMALLHTQPTHFIKIPQLFSSWDKPLYLLSLCGNFPTTFTFKSCAHNGESNSTKCVANFFHSLKITPQATSFGGEVSPQQHYKILYSPILLFATHKCCL